MTTELRALGREGRSGAVDVDAAGLVVVVIAVEAAGLPAIGAVDNAFPAAPALSHGFGGEGVAMVLDISVVASRYDIDWIQIDLSRD